MDESAAVQRLAEAARRITVRGRPDETMLAVALTGPTVVPGCDLASVSVRRGDVFETAATTDAALTAVDGAQYELGAGPCVEAIRTGELRVVADLGLVGGEPLAARAAAAGVHGVLSVPLTDEGATFGSLNLYARSPGEFDADDLVLARAYAAHAALAITAARLQSELQDAMATRQTIGQAVGVLTERHGIAPQEAFEMLARASQNRNVKVRDLARTLLESGLRSSQGARPRRVGSTSAEPLLRVEELGDGRVGMRLVGEVDASTRDLLADRLRALGGRGDVHLDLAGLTFVDVDGVRLLVRAAEQSHHTDGGRLLLHRPPAVLTQIAELLFRTSDLDREDPLVLPYGSRGAPTR